MGFWAKVKSGIKKVGKAIVGGVKKIARFVKEKVTNVWNKFSGKDKFEEAEKLYQDIEKRYRERRRRFDQQLNEYTDKIEQHVKSINKSKEMIKGELFLQMARKMEKIKDISVSQDFSVEAYMAEALSFDDIRSKSQLYKIDFNKHKFKTTFQAIFTLGFYTRKKAKETLLAVQEEEKKVDHEISKMDAEIVKLKAIEKSLSNVEFYFTSLIEMYENLLIRLDSSVNYLFVRCMNFAHRLVREEMSIRKLPVMQQKEVEAIISASQILKAMTDAQITSIGEKKEVETYKTNMKDEYDKMCEAYRAA